MIFLIAALHALPPIIGAWLFGNKGWFYGIVIGGISALTFGALVFTIPDLIGVAVGTTIGYQILQNRGDTVNTDEVNFQKKFKNLNKSRELTEEEKKSAKYSNSSNKEFLFFFLVVLPLVMISIFYIAITD